MAGRLSNPNQQFFDENGDPLSGGKLSFFVAGTSTPQDTYSDDALTVPNTNPVILDDAGRAGDVFLLNKDYKVVLSDANDAVVWTADPVRSTQPKSTAVRQVSATTVLDASDDGKWIAANANAAAFTITLPNAVVVGNGYEVTIQKVDSSANEVTVATSNGQTINGLSDVQLDTQYEAIYVRSDGSNYLSPVDEGRTLDPNHINGFTLENTAGTLATDVTIGAGSARSDEDKVNIVLSNSITKKLNAIFSEGNNQGGLDSGSVAANSVYEIFVISKDDGTSDCLFSLKGGGETLPSGFTNKRLIGSLETDDSSNIVNNSFMRVKIDGQHSYHEIDTTSGSEVFVRGLPDGPDWLDIGLNGTSFNGTHNFTVQGGDDSTLQESGYTGTIQSGAPATVWSTSALVGQQLLGSTIYYASMRMGIASTNGDTYHSHVLGATGSDIQYAAGFFNLDGKVLSRLRFAPSAGEFDAGKITVRAFRSNQED